MEIGIQRRMVPHIPWGLVGATAVVGAIGVWNLASAGRLQAKPVWPSQGLYLMIGFVLAALVALFDYRWIQRMALPLYLANVGALVALKFLGVRVKGAVSWFAIGPVRVQPAELMKISLVLMLAKFLHDDYRPNETKYGFLRLIKPAVIVMLPAVLVLLEPELGTAIIICLTAGTMLLFSGVKRRVLVALALGGALTSAVIWNDYARDPSETHATFIRHHLKRHQSRRISSWLNPDEDLKGANYHAAQSMIAVGSGELTGKGWGQGTQTGLSFLPEQHTDFIFSVWAEEHGFLACLGLLVLYGIILLTALGVGFVARDRFGAMVVVGVAAMLFWQIFENIGMVIGLLPVTGITLPLLSYGGSSMISVLISVGLLVNVAIRRHLF